MPACLLVETNAPMHENDGPDMTSAEDRWLNVLEVAARFGVRHDTIYRQLRRGIFPCHAMKVGRVWRVSAADVDRFLSVIEGRDGEVGA
jgi:excisionase family DNA binding protein